MRRKFIPPLMETYQEIYVISVFTFPYQATDDEKQAESNFYLRNVHQVVCDTCYASQKQQPIIYKQIVTLKSEALIMDESAMSFYSQQLSITPEILDDAWKYLY